MHHSIIKTMGESGYMTTGKSKVGINATLLLASGLICKVVGALFRLPLTNVLGVEGIGVFQLIMSTFSFALVLSSGGATVALSKLVASHRAKGDFVKLNACFRRAMFQAVGLATLLGVLLALCWKNISNFQHINPNKSYLLFVILLPLGAGMAVFRGYFQGQENMLPTTVSQILEQSAKFVLGLALAVVFSKQSLTSGVFGAFLGITLSEVLTVALLFVWHLRKRKRCVFYRKAKNLWATRKEYDKSNFLLTLSAISLPLANMIDSFFIVGRLQMAGLSASRATELFGVQTGIVGTMLNLPLSISVAVAAACLPNFAFLMSKGENVGSAIEKGFKLLLFFVLPTTFGLAAVAKVLYSLIYPMVTYEILLFATNLTLYSAFATVFTALMQYAIMILQAKGEFGFVAVLTAMASVVKVVLTICLAGFSFVNVYALAIGNLVFSGIVCVVALAKLKRSFNFKISFWQMGNLLVATLLMYVSASAFLQVGSLVPMLALIGAVLIGVFVYFFAVAPFAIKTLFPLFHKKETQNV